MSLKYLPRAGFYGHLFMMQSTDDKPFTLWEKCLVIAEKEDTYIIRYYNPFEGEMEKEVMKKDVHIIEL